MLSKLNAIIWGMPMLLLILFTGIILTVKTKFFQIRYLKRAIKTFFKTEKGKSKNKLSAFGAACTALAGTMGVGNIVGVAGAISLGGAGAVFWMWVSALLSMIIKFAEIALAVRYREQGTDGCYSGGAMYYIKKAFPKRLAPISMIFCICGAAAAFGIGNLTQINTIAANINQMAKAFFQTSCQTEFYIKLLAGVLCAVICATVLRSDGRVGAFCEKLMPILTVAYIVIALGTVILNYKNIPIAFYSIFKGAFSPRSVTGGAVGSVFVGMRYGIARGVFSNEAGMGTAPTAYACSEGDEIGLGLLGITEVFIDTMVVCTLTALAILCSTDIAYGADLSSMLTLAAFKSAYGGTAIFILCPLICFFAFSSVIGWGLYGTKFITYALGEKSKKYFLLVFVTVMIPAAVFKSESAWTISELLNGFMIIPNTAALLCLTNEVADITNNA